MRQLSALVICTECGMRLNKGANLKKHLQKHKLAKQQGGALSVHKPYSESTCSQCGIRTSNFTKHYCTLVERTCHNGSMKHIYVNFESLFESLCEQEDWYQLDPNFDSHVCMMRCKTCKLVFRSEYSGEGYDGARTHFDTCPERKEVFVIYRYKGVMTDEEYAAYEKTDEWYDRTEEDEIEREYAKWKEQQPSTTPRMYVQKPYRVYE